MRSTVGGVAVMVILMFFAAGGMVWYIGLRLRRWLGAVFQKEHFLGKWFWPLHAGLALVPVGLGLFYKYSEWRLPQLVGSYVFGFVLLSLMLYLLCDAVHGILRVTFFRGERWKQRKTQIIQISGAFVIAGSFFLTGFGAWTAWNAQTTEYRITVEKQTTLSQLNIVMVSDLHLGGIIGYERMEKMVREINELHPDLVCIAGDLFDGNFNEIQEPEKISQLLRTIESRYGVFACWGNHDIGRTFGKMKSMIEDSGIILLEDECHEVGGLFTVAGRLDAKNADLQKTDGPSFEDAMADIDPSLPVILLDHQPSRLEEDSAMGADLVLCGHTHNGQIFPGNLVVALLNENAYGYSQKNGTHVIVSSGYGSWGPPVRLGSISEVVHITADFASN